MNIVIQRISYQDYDKKIVNYGDGEPGTEDYSIYLFENMNFKGIDRVWRTNSNERRYKEYEFFRNNDDGMMYVRHYSISDGRFLSQDIYEKNNNALIANGGRQASLHDVIARDADKYIYFRSYRNYSMNRPETVIEFFGKDITVSFYNSLTGEPGNRRYYQDGILMKVEYFRDGRIAEYTVRSGVGEIITTDAAGTVTERSRLERRLGEDGCLVYEGIRRANGTGSEYIVRKDIFQ
jgi:hypothetical protein